MAAPMGLVTLLTLLLMVPPLRTWAGVCGCDHTTTSVSHQDIHVGDGGWDRYAQPGCKHRAALKSLYVTCGDAVLACLDF